MFVRWFWPHVFVKGGWVGNPTITNPYPTTAVILVRNVIAALQHSAPNNVFSGSAQPMFSLSRGGHFGVQTPAASDCPDPQFSSLNNGCVSAIAHTLPFFSSENVFDCDKPIEPFVQKVVNHFSSHNGRRIHTRIGLSKQM